MITIPFIMASYGELITAEYILVYFLFGLMSVALNLGLTQAGNNIIIQQQSKIDYKLLHKINTTRTTIFHIFILVIPLLYILEIVSVYFLISLGYLFIPLLLPMEWLINHYNKSAGYLQMRVLITLFMSIFRIVVCMIGLPGEVIFFSLSIEGVISFLIIRKKQRFYQPILNPLKRPNDFYMPNVNLWLYDLLNSFKNRIDVYILSFLFLENAVGYYGILISTLNIIPLITNSVMTVALPRIMSDNLLRNKIMVLNFIIVAFSVLFWVILCKNFGRNIYGEEIFTGIEKYIIPTSFIGLMYGVNQATNLKFLTTKMYNLLLQKTCLMIAGVFSSIVVFSTFDQDITPVTVILVCAFVPIFIDTLYLRARSKK